jgi:DNA-binding transcriptional LysR family regulator
MLIYSLTSLIVFSAVVKNKSFSRAADALFMTQPGVSSHVAQLEAQVGVSLIRRESGKFSLTKEGRAVYRYAERIETMARELEDKLRELRNDRTASLRIGTTINYARTIMPYMLAAFQKRAPDIRIKLDAGSSDKIEKTIISGQNDVVIVATPRAINKIQSTPFFREELVLIVSRNHPLAAHKTASLSDILPYPFIIREEGSATRGVVLSAFTRMGLNPSVIIEVNSTEFIKEWVSEGKGVSILIRRAINRVEDTSIIAIPLTEPMFMEVSVLYLKSRKHDRAIQQFVAYLKDVVQETSTGLSATQETPAKRRARAVPERK